MCATYISCSDLKLHLDDESWVVVDCRTILGSATAGEQLFREGHLPGAGYANLAKALSGTVIPGKTGRHPLPGKDALVETLRALGISNGTQVVAYDAEIGQLAAARLWWLLKWAGHKAVAVLDGGITKWKELGLPLESAIRPRTPGTFEAAFRDELRVDIKQIEESVRSGELLLVDSRSADRYRGENETIDPIAGHIPGAISLPFTGNGSEGLVRPKEALQGRFQDALGSTQSHRVAFYCGSGVTAAQNVLAYSHAGLGMPKLYPGSWSEWIARERGV